MGHVYRARDTKLGRDVAIKILPDVFTSDSDRRARFEREARLLAALNHPHIGAIYGFEDRDGVHALVLELIEGQTLAERLRAGPLSVDETLAIARQVADALQAAHDKGIVHRDLKPANIAITADGIAKVLDFGLATTRAVDSPGDVVDSAALTTSGTRDGVILGTAPYMSPEQARGKTVDKRTDIWALGCVMYEMLTAHRAFAGDTVSDTIAAILDREPDWSLLPAATPPNLRRLLHRCLEKDPKRRLHDSADVRIEIDDVLAPRPSVAAATTTSNVRRHRLAPLILTTLVAMALVGGLLIWNAIAPPQSGVTRFTITLPANITLRDPMALSPDGRTLVYTGVDTDGSRLYRRTLDTLESVAIRGTEGGGRPFFSPDGRSIGFISNRVLKRVPLQGGAPVTVHEAHVDHSATWLSDDTIVFGWENRGLMRVPAAGGEARQITVVDRARGEIEHHSPVGISGNRALLFTVHTGARDAQRIDALALDSGQRVPLIQGSGPNVLPTGHIVFAYQRSGALWIAPFDEKRLQVTASPTPVLEDVAISDGWIPTIAVGSNGSLAYATGQAEFASYTPRKLV